MTDDPFLTYDAAYILGALVPPDHRAYEQHLRQCPTCAAAVREVADLPALLSAAGPEAFTHSIPASRPPATLPPRLLESVRRERHHLRLTVFATLAAAACLLAVIIAVAGLHTHTPASPQRRRRPR
jgi:anti-sigma factor RsiW